MSQQNPRWFTFKRLLTKPPVSKLKRCWMLVPSTRLLFTPDKLDYVSKMKWPKGKSAAA
jgi:hypothetical protein